VAPLTTCKPPFPPLSCSSQSCSIFEAFILGDEALLAAFSGASLMAESATRNFVSQWAYDHGQSREDGRDEAAMQWLGAGRVAEQARQRQDNHLEKELAAMDFEARAATLEAHFFQPFPAEQSARTVARSRPQSASVARRAAESEAAGASHKRTRSQSAKTRSDSASSSMQPESQVRWKARDQQHTSKWREMLARGPEFKQLTLRRLELETYELLYNTLQQQQVVQPKATTRRRKRRSSGGGANTQSCRPEDTGPVLACGSGLHLARSRKKRQQEHDRQMMLGKGRRTSRSNELDRDKIAMKDKRAIQDKTRQRSKLLKTKKSHKQLQGQQDPESRHEKQQHESILLRQPSAQRTARCPWVPAGSASSLAIRGISSNANDTEAPQDKRVAEVVDAFRSHTDTHLRLSKHVQKQLKRALQSAKTSREVKTSVESKAPAERVRPRSASSRKNVSADSWDGSSSHAIDTRKAETSLLVPPARQPPQSGSESLFSGSPATLTLVVPPLKLPPRAWEDQDTSDVHNTASELSQDTSFDPQSAVNSSQRKLSEQSTPQAEPTDTEGNETVVKMEAKPNMNSEAGLDSIPAQERKGIVSCTDTSLQHPASGGSNLDEITQQETRNFEQNEEKVRRVTTIEDEYLAEGLVEQGSTGVSTGTDESSSTELDAQFPAMEARFEGSMLDPGSDVTGSTIACLHEDAVSSGTVEAHVAGDLPDQVDTPANETKELDVELSGDVKSTRSPVEIELFTHSPASLDLDAVEVGKLAEMSQNNSSNAQLPLDLERSHGSSSDAIESGGLNGRAEPVNALHCVSETARDAMQDDALSLVEESTRSERRPSENSCDEPAAIADKDSDSTSLAAVANQPEQNSSPLVGLTSLNVLLTNGAEEALWTSPSNDLGESCDQNGTVEGSTAMDVGVSMLQTPSLEIEEPILDVLDSVHAPDRSEVAQHASHEPADKHDLDGGLANALPPVGDQHFTLDNGDHQATQYKTAVSSSSLHSQSPTVELVATAPTSQPASVDSPSIADEGKSLRPAVECEHTPTNPFNSGDKDELRSPKKKSRKSSSGKTFSSKQKKSVAVSEAAASNVEPTATASLPEQGSSTTAKGGSSDRSEQEPSRSQKQAATRSFLTRVASGKTIAPALSPVQPGDLGQQGDTFGSTAESTVEAAMDADTQQKRNAVKEREDSDSESALALEPEHLPALSDCESTVEKYRRATEDNPTPESLAAAPPSERLDMATSFASVNDSSTVASAVANTNANDTVDQAPPELEPIAPSASGDLEPSAWEPPLSTADKVVLSHRDPGANVQKHHDAACKIQAQYRCFVRRRLILDQLRFMVAKQRRQARRKSRQKGKKVVSESSPMAAAVDAGSMDRPPEDVQQVAPALIDSDSAIEVPSEASPYEAPEPSAEDEKLAARKDSCEYAFELFGGAKEVGQDAVDVVEASSTNATWLERLDVQQEDRTALPEKDVAVAASTATSSELVQGEDQALEADAAPLLEVEQVQEQPAFPAAGGGFLTSTLLAELAFSDDVEEDPTAEAAGPQAHWERYVDSSTSKSYYFNPTTNETQWTAPEDRDAAAVNSSRATLSAPRAAADAAGTWQEFLDEASGQMYYFNIKTGECSWELPAESAKPAGVVVSPQSIATAESAAVESAWIMYIDPASQAPYYVNVETLATSWERPDDYLAPEAVREDAYVIAVEDHATLDLEI